MFVGSITALLTPFRDGRLDEECLKTFVDWQITEGSHGLVPCGTTGESSTLSHDEHKRVIELTIAAARGRVPVIAGAGSNSTAEALELARYAEAAGAQAILVVAPYYNKPTQSGLYEHFRQIDQAVNLPIIVYNIPARSVVEISVETLGRIFEDCKNVIGVKDATANLLRPSLERIRCGRDLNLLSGEDGTALGYMAHGGQGCISVTSNIAPKLCSQFQAACLAGNFREALEIQDRLMPLHQALFLEGNPAGPKYAASRLRLMAYDLRLPLVQISQSAAGQIDKALEIAGLL